MVNINRHSLFLSHTALIQVLVRPRLARSSPSDLSPYFHPELSQRHSQPMCTPLATPEPLLNLILASIFASPTCLLTTRPSGKTQFPEFLLVTLPINEPELYLLSLALLSSCLCLLILFRLSFSLSPLPLNSVRLHVRVSHLCARIQKIIK